MPMWKLCLLWFYHVDSISWSGYQIHRFALGTKHSLLCYISKGSSMDLRLQCDRTTCVAGPTNTRKTSFVLSLLEHRNKIFKCTTNCVIWFYGIHQSKLSSSLQCKGYLFYSSIVDVSDIQPHDIIVLDDLIHESKNSQNVTAIRGWVQK